MWLYCCFFGSNLGGCWSSFMSKLFQEKAVAVRSVKPETVWSLEEPFVSYIAELWQNSGIQSAYRRRREFQLTDSAYLYFLFSSKIPPSTLICIFVAFLPNCLDYRRKIICQQMKTYSGFKMQQRLESLNTNFCTANSIFGIHFRPK